LLDATKSQPSATDSCHTGVWRKSDALRSEDTMRLISRHRQQPQRRSHIAITEAEIAADLHYPAPVREPNRSDDARRLQAR